MDSIVEQWKPVVGYEGLYEVSDQGRVKTLHAKRWCGNHWQDVEPRIMKQTIGIQGYPVVKLTKQGKGKTWTVHTLVLSSFVCAKPSKQECRHLNGNRQDSRLCNLTWGSPAENDDDRKRHGTLPCGTNHHAAKLTEDQVLRIRAAIGTHRNIASEFGVSSSVVSNIKARRSWVHVQ